MNKLYIRNFFIVLAFFLTLTSAVMYSSGPDPQLTNAPGESNCTGCHSGSLITSGNSNLNKIILETGFPGGGYVPDSLYEISLSFKQSGIKRYGFEITCLTSSNNDPAGTFTASTSRVQKKTAIVSTKTREYIEHTTSGLDTVRLDSTKWTFKWKAPSTNVGKVKFYVVLMASNKDGSDGGDVVYGKTFEYGMSPLLSKANVYSADSVTCNNYTIQMNGSGTNSPTGYTWKFTNATPNSSTLQNPSVKFTSPGTQLAILTVKNQYGPGASDTLKVNVKLSPSASISNGSAGTICKGDSLLLSANTGSNLQYKWTPSNKTLRSIYVKDTGIYYVTTTLTTTQCATKSANFKLQWYPKPELTITNKVSDTVCGQISETISANMLSGDSVLWYVNNKLYARTKSPSFQYTGSGNASIYGIAKNLNNCFSLPSNVISRIVTNKIFPNNFNIVKSTSNIHMGWTKTPGIDSVQYSINNINFFRALNDTALDLSGLSPTTFYNIRVRSFQKNACQFTDTVISVKTNNCSNISYSLSLNSNICLGESITAKVVGLRKSQTSISFENGSFGADTSYTFQPSKSDSLSIRIVDSLSLTCPAIQEKLAYIVDTFPNDPGIYNLNLTSCSNKYLYVINPLYKKYDFYLNNTLKYSGPNNIYEFTGLATGDKLSVNIHNNSCTKQIGLVNFTRSQAADALFTYTRVWKVYTFKPNDSTNVDYTWFINDTLKANSQKFISDMSAYSGKTAKIKLITKNFPGCVDSIEQTVNFPDFTSVKTLFNNKLAIYPNPFNHQVTIETDMTDYSITVFDNIGKVVLQSDILSANQTIDTEQWTKGIYHFVIMNAAGRKVSMLIKL